MQKKILIIDDEEDFSHFVKLNLEKTKQFKVWAFSDPQEGITFAKYNRPELIFLDINMPAMDGTEVALKLQNDPDTKEIPIIYLTALIRKEEIDSGKGMIGGRSFLAKPVTTEELIAKINSVLTS